MDFLHLTHDVLSVDHVLKLVSSETCGAVSMFVGTTRNNFDGKEVVQLEYEAYDTMALKVMKNICNDIRNKWSEVHKIAIYHRLGTVPVLEASVVIAVSSPHRVDSMAAVQFCIEHLKEGDKFIFEKCKMTDEPNTSQISIDPNIIQVNASNEEIQRRINNFIDKKRDQINLCNIQDFIIHKGEISESSEAPDTCARVNAVLVKRKDSKSHLNVMRVHNEWGPQTKVEKKEIVRSNVDSKNSKNAIEERLLNAETHINVAKPIPCDIYSRLKKIEDRILELESISPEYVMFWARNSQEDNSSENTLPAELNPTKVFKFSSEEIQKKLQALEQA